MWENKVVYPKEMTSVDGSISLIVKQIVLPIVTMVTSAVAAACLDTGVGKMIPIGTTDFGFILDACSM